MSIVYGVSHDLITAHICLEYFTVYHPHIIDSENPVAMAFLWGVLATWWFGLGAGLLIGWISIRGPLPALKPVPVLMMIAKAMVIVFGMAMATLVVCLAFGKYLPIDMVLPRDLLRSVDRQRFSAVGATHEVSYFANLIAAIVVCFRISRLRRRAGGQL